VAPFALHHILDLPVEGAGAQDRLRPLPSGVKLERTGISPTERSVSRAGCPFGGLVEATV
jgi:hypothetical protein